MNVYVIFYKGTVTRSLLGGIIRCDGNIGAQGLPLRLDNPGPTKLTKKSWAWFGFQDQQPVANATTKSGLSWP